MSFTIPIWCLWVLGIPLGILTIGTAIIGCAFIVSFAGVWRMAELTFNLGSNDATY